MNRDDAAFAKPATLYPDGSSYEYSQDGLTARQYAAIHLRVPDNGEEWLDSMIEKSLRNELQRELLEDL